MLSATRLSFDRFFHLLVQGENLFWPELHRSSFFFPDPEGSLTGDLSSGLFYDNRSDRYHPSTYYPKRLPSVDQVAQRAKEGKPMATQLLSPTRSSRL